MGSTSREQSKLQGIIQKKFNNTDVKEAKKGFTSDSYDQYVNMKLALDQGGDRPAFTRVRKRLKDANDRLIGVANNNLIL